MFNVGDIVQVKPDLKLDYYGGVNTVKEMVDMAGQVFEIKSVYRDLPVTYMLRGDKDRWSWTGSMLNQYVPREADTSLLLDLYKKD